MNFDDKRKEISNKIKELSAGMDDIVTLQTRPHELLVFKNELLRAKAELSNTYDKVRRNIDRTMALVYKRLNGNSLNEAEMGMLADIYTTFSDYTNNFDTMPKNDKERTALRSYLLYDQLLTSDVINNHITFLDNSITSVANLIYMVESFVAIYKIKNGIQW